jgi:hypothetical protein
MKNCVYAQESHRVTSVARWLSGYREERF